MRFLSCLTHTTLNLDRDKVVQRPLKDAHQFNYGASAAMLSVHPQCLCHADDRHLLLCLSPGFKTMAVICVEHFAAIHAWMALGCPCFTRIGVKMLRSMNLGQCPGV